MRDNEKVSVHLVGHSAGSILLAPLLSRLAERHISVETLALMAPAIRVDDFMREVYPHLTSTVERSALYGLGDKRELDDEVGSGAFAPYHKSLLYLVSRALERAVDGTGEVPLLGMEKFLTSTQDGVSVEQSLRSANAEYIFTGGRTTGVLECEAVTHGSFDEDKATMTSIARFILDRREVLEFEKNIPLLSAGGPRVKHGEEIMETATPRFEEAAISDKGTPLTSSSSSPLDEQVEIESYEPSTQLRTGSAIIDLLERSGWKVEQSKISKGGPGGKRKGD